MKKIQYVRWYFAGNPSILVKDIIRVLYPYSPILTRSTITKIVHQFNEAGNVYMLQKI